VRQTAETVATLDAAQRLKRNVRRLLDEQRGLKGPRRTISGLAGQLELKPNGVSTILKASGVPHFKLRQVDQIAEYFGVPPAVLIKEDDSNLVELTPSEMRLIRIWREWPREIQHHVLEMLAFFAALAPAEKQARRYLSKFRRLNRKDQDYVERTLDSLLRHTVEPGTAAPVVPRP
jgi:hypothetical protein